MSSILPSTKEREALGALALRWVSLRCRKGGGFRKPEEPACGSHCAVLSSCISQVSAFCLTVLGSAGAFGKSKIEEWPLYEVSGLGLSADP